MKKLSLFFAIFGGVLGTYIFVYAYINESLFLLIMGALSVACGVIGVVDYFKPEKL